MSTETEIPPGLDSAIPSDATAALLAVPTFRPKPTRVTEQRRILPPGGFAELNQPATFLVVKESDGPLAIALDEEAEWEAAPGLTYEAPEDRPWVKLTVKNPSATAALKFTLLVGVGRAALVRPRGKGVVTGSISATNAVPAGVATAASAVEIPVWDGFQVVNVQVAGAYTGALSLQGTVNGSAWVTLGGPVFFDLSTGTTAAEIASAAVGIFAADVQAFRAVRVTALGAVTGSATITIVAA